MPNFIRYNKGAYRWFINEAHQKLVQTQFIGKERLLAELARGETVLKDNNARTLFTFSAPQYFGLFIKRYKINSLFRSLRNIIQSPPMTELRISNYLVTKGRPTVYPIALLQEKKWWFMPVDAYLVFKKLDDIPAVQDYITDDLSREGLNEIIDLSGTLIKDIHNVNLFHRDLHLGNVLIKPGVPPQLLVIDVHRATLLPGVTHAQRIFNLAQFGYSLWRLVPFTNVIRLLRAYRWLDLRRPRFKAMVRAVFNTILTLRFRHWQGRTRHCLRNSSRCLMIKESGRNIYINRDFTGIKDKIIELTRAGGYTVKETRHHRLSIHNIGVDRFYVKEYRHIKLFSRIRSLFEYYPARMGWLAGNGFVIRQIPTADPVALIAQKVPFWDWVQVAWLITKEIKTTPSNQYVTEQFTVPKPGLVQRKKEFIRDFAMAIRQLHHKGVFHCDLKANNVMIRDIPDNERRYLSHQWEFYFIDLDRVRFRKRLPWRERIKNLAQLNAAMPAVMTRADRLRFFRHYAYGEIKPHTAKEQDIIQEIMAITIERHHIWPGR